MEMKVYKDIFEEEIVNNGDLPDDLATKGSFGLTSIWKNLLK